MEAGPAYGKHRGLIGAIRQGRGQSTAYTRNAATVAFFCLLLLHSVGGTLRDHFAARRRQTPRRAGQSSMRKANSPHHVGVHGGSDEPNARPALGLPPRSANRGNELAATLLDRKRKQFDSGNGDANATRANTAEPS
jgi:hypothetical protein